MRQLGGFGKPPVPQQKDDFLKSAVVRQRMNVIAAVAQDALVSVDVANLGFARNDAFQPSRHRSHRSSILGRRESARRPQSKKSAVRADSRRPRIEERWER